MTDTRGARRFQDSSEVLKNIRDEIYEVEGMLKALIKSLENKPWNPFFTNLSGEK
jgi:hypothetical protein